jgi:hypothetical protein
MIPITKFGPTIVPAQWSYSVDRIAAVALTFWPRI